MKNYRMQMRNYPMQMKNYRMQMKNYPMQMKKIEYCNVSHAIHLLCPKFGGGAQTHVCPNFES